MHEVVYILFGWLFTVVSPIALGRLFLNRLHLRLYREEQILFSFLAGAALLSTLVFAMCALGVVYKGVFLAAGIAAIAVWLRAGPVRVTGESLAALQRRWKLLFFVIYAIYCVLYFFNALAPEHSPDGIGYHLGLVARYYREHGFHPINTTMYANLSQGMEMLFLFAFAFGRHSAAAMVHFAFLVVLPIAMLAFARRFGLGGCGVIAAILVFASPVVGIDGISAYNDVGVTCVLFGLFYLLQIWDADRQPGLLILIGLLAGFGYAVKYTAVAGVLYAVLFVLWKSRKVRPAMVVSVCAVCMMAPWLGKNIVFVGNPFAPFANALFPNPMFEPTAEKSYAHDMRTFNEVAYPDIPVQVTVRGELLGGILGPIFLLTPVALLACRYRMGRQIVLAACVFTVPYFANIGTRFLIPCLPFWSLGIALALRNAPALAILVCLVHALASWPAYVGKYCHPYAWRLQKVPVAEAFRRVPADKYLSEQARGYVLARAVEAHVPAGERVFSFGGSIAEAYTSREILVGFQSAFNRALRDILYIPLIHDFQPIWAHRFQFPARPLRKIRIIQTAKNNVDRWSITELRLYSKGVELARGPDWRLRAWPSPWTVQKAFDNSPVTRWESGTEIFPGEFVEVDLGRPTELDTVRVECSRDQYQTRLRLDALDAGGKWTTISNTPETEELDAPKGLRKAATEEFKRAGVRYILVEDYDYGALDLIAGAPVWGLHLIEEKGGAHLYRVE